MTSVSERPEMTASQNHPLPAEISQWLIALRDALASLPAKDRDDILNEAGGHLEDRIAAGLTATQALHGFGPAKAYAQNFVDNYALETALHSRKVILMIKTLFGFTGRSLVAFFGLMGALVFGGIALGSVVSIVLKLIRPDMVGLWINDATQNYILGTTNDHVGFHEAAGSWVYLIFVVLIMVGGFLGRASLLAAIKSIKGKTQPAYPVAS